MSHTVGIGAGCGLVHNTPPGSPRHLMRDIMLTRWLSPPVFAGSALVVVSLAGCGGATQPPPAADSPPAVLPAEAAPAAAAPEPASKLTLQVITASPEGFLVTSTLVSGAKDAVLIDAQFTLAD